MSSETAIAKPMSYTLDDLINARLKADAEEAAKEAAARAARKEANQAEAIQRLQQRLHACLNPGFLAVLPPITYTADFYDQSEQVETAWATFELYDHTWKITEGRAWNLWVAGTHLGYTSGQDLKHDLLRYFARVRDGQLTAEAPTPHAPGVVEVEEIPF